MLLAVDVGNTNIVLGGFDGDDLKFVSRIQTVTSRMPDEYSITIDAALRFHGFSPDRFEGVMISCVVPPLAPLLKEAIGNLMSCRVMTVSPGSRTGLNIKIDNPAILGADLVAGAVGAIAKYPLPCVVVDLGTATKFSVIDRDGSFVGASILPGVMLSLEALSKGTATLPHIDFGGMVSVIGRNSPDSMRSGIIYGTASMIDGMLKRISQELGEDVFAVATGGIAPSIIPHCEAKIVTDETIVLNGIKLIYQRSRAS